MCVYTYNYLQIKIVVFNFLPLDLRQFECTWFCDIRLDFL